MRARAILAVVLMLRSLAAQADAPSISPRPLERPQSAAVLPNPDAVPKQQASAGTPVPATPHPKPRPASLSAAALPDPELAVLPPVTPKLRPKARPAALAKAAAMPDEETAAANPAKTKPKREKRTKKGSVCGDAAIRGEKLARIKGKVKGCGVEQPVQVTSVGGVRLNPPATLDCDTASALNRWVERGMRQSFRGREVVELRIAAHYICRSRNNVKGNKISEHGRGKAIDIAAFVFSDGTEMSVARNYGKEMRKAYKAACGTFGTTLGPGSDGYHEDHLHFDTAGHSNGPYCR